MRQLISSKTLLSPFQNFASRCSSTERRLLFRPLSCPRTLVSTRRVSSSRVCNKASYETQRIEGSEESPSSSPPDSPFSTLQSGSSICSFDHDTSDESEPSWHPSVSPSWNRPESSTPSIVLDLTTNASRLTSEATTPSLVLDLTTNTSWLTSEITTPSSLYPFNNHQSVASICCTASDATSAVALDVLSEARAFFEIGLGSRCGRAVALVRAVKGFLEPAALAAENYRNLWSARSKIFLGSKAGPIARLRRLHDGLLRIKRGREDYDCAGRFCYIFLEHDLEQLVMSGSFQMSRGRGRKSAALSAQAASISVTEAVVRADRKAGRAYVQLLLEGGPGLLLLIGRYVNTMWVA